MQGKRSQLKVQPCKLRSSSYSSMNGIFRCLVALSSPESTLPNSNSRQISSILTDVINYKELQIPNPRMYRWSVRFITTIDTCVNWESIRFQFIVSFNMPEIAWSWVPVRPSKRNTNLSLPDFCIKKGSGLFLTFSSNHLNAFLTNYYPPTAGIII